MAALAEELDFGGHSYYLSDQIICIIYEGTVEGSSARHCLVQTLTYFGGSTAIMGCILEKYLRDL